MRSVSLTLKVSLLQGRRWTVGRKQAQGTERYLEHRFGVAAHGQCILGLRVTQSWEGWLSRVDGIDCGWVQTPGDVAALAWANVSAGGVGCYVRKADAMSSATKLLTLALLQVSLNPSPFADGEYFNQTLSLSTASIVILAGGSSFESHKVRMEILVDATDNVVYISTTF